MTLAVTNPAALAVPPFSAGLEHFSQSTGRPGTPTYDEAGFAAFVPADPDFGSALEIQKISATTSLRWVGEVPVLPGSYLRLRLRIKAMAGVMPDVRLAAWVGDSEGEELTGLTTSAAQTSLTSYGAVVELTAIIGTGARPGVDMVWPLAASFAHLGFDLTGPTGGVVRVDDLAFEDVSALYAADLLSVVDPRDFGALGDGSSDDRPAFLAALDAANGRRLLVPDGEYFIGGDLVIDTEAVFRGTLSLDEGSILILQRNFDLPGYEAAMGSPELGFRKGLQALFHTSSHTDFNLRGRRVRLHAPVDVFALAGQDGSVTRRSISNGLFDCVESPDWHSETQTSIASYDPANPLTLSDVADIADIEVGAHVSGVGVGREVYVRARNIAAGTLTLSQALHGGAMTQDFTFERFKYILDFSGFSNMRNFELHMVEFMCRGRGNCVMLPEDGRVTRFSHCYFNRPSARAITSIGRGCQGLIVDHCQFSSSQMTTPSQDRTVIAFNVNANDAKIRNNRAVMWAHFGVMHGSGHLILGNHFFAGDGAAQGIRQAGIVLTRGNAATTISGNYIDNCFIELSNEHDPNPDFTTGFSFGGVTITGNIFMAISVAPWFTWIVVSPYGEGHYIQGLQISGNVFRTVSSRIDRAEALDTTRASLDFGRTRNLIFENNAYNGIDYPAENPAVIVHDQNTEATNWTIDSGGKLPFGARLRTVSGVVMENPLRDEEDNIHHHMPYAQTGQGPDSDQARLRWPVALRGRVVVTMRVDRPV